MNTDNDKVQQFKPRLITVDECDLILQIDQDHSLQQLIEERNKKQQQLTKEEQLIKDKDKAFKIKFFNDEQKQIEEKLQQIKEEYHQQTLQKFELEKELHSLKIQESELKKKLYLQIQNKYDYDMRYIDVLQNDKILNRIEEIESLFQQFNIKQIICINSEQLCYKNQQSIKHHLELLNK
ncbi:Hypothetical_protein [Hexamita inflata]|uniref:Hypothetical_protein n=1 Tax=Hexamita inflata TaxID=28002 RepID=A0ABP1KRB4_9EUKA